MNELYANEDINMLFQEMTLIDHRLDKFLDTCEKVTELVAVINKHGLEDSIKDLFGQDLAQLSPAYAAGKGSSLVIDELNIACEGLGQKAIQLLKDLLKRLVEFLKQIWNAIFHKSANTEKKILLLESRVHEYKQLAAAPASTEHEKEKKQEAIATTKHIEHDKISNEIIEEHGRVAIDKDTLIKFIVNTTNIEKDAERILDEVIKDPASAYSKHKQLFDIVGLKYNPDKKEFGYNSEQIEKKPFTEMGYSAKITDVLTIVDGSKDWLKHRARETVTWKSVSRYSDVLVAELEKHREWHPAPDRPRSMITDPQHIVEVQIRNVNTVQRRLTTFIYLCIDTLDKLITVLRFELIDKQSM